MVGISQSNSNALKNPWALGIIATLIVFLCGNAVFIYLAFESAPSLVVKDFYEKGEAYEQTQKNLEKEKALGWNAMLLSPKLRVNQSKPFEVLIQGQNSAAVPLDSVVLYAYRPSDHEADFSVAMDRVQAGMYKADVSFSLPGIWDLIVEAKQGEDKIVTTERISVLP